MDPNEILALGLEASYHSLIDAYGQAIDRVNAHMAPLRDTLIRGDTPTGHDLVAISLLEEVAAGIALSLALVAHHVPALPEAHGIDPGIYMAAYQELVRHAGARLAVATALIAREGTTEEIGGRAQEVIESWRAELLAASKPSDPVDLTWIDNLLIH